MVISITKIIYTHWLLYICIFKGRVVHVDGSYAAVKFPCVSKEIISGIFPKDKEPNTSVNDDVVTNIIKMLDQNEVRLMKKDDLQVNNKKKN